MANADRRYTYRLDLPEDRVRVFAPSTGKVVVADLSASGSGLIVSPADFERMTAEPATFELGAGRSFSARLDPVRVAKREGHLHVGARFQDLPVAGMRVLSEFLIREFLDETRTLDRLLLDPRTLTTRSETFIRRYLRRCLIAERRPLRVYDGGNVLPFTILADRIVEMHGRYLIEARSQAIGVTEGTAYTFVIAQSGSVTHFAARVEHRSGDTLFIPLPAELHQAGFRDSVRTPLQSDGRATVRCAHPRLPDELIVRPLLDLSAKGFAFESDPETDLLFPGDRLSFVQVRFAEEVFEGTGVIRRVAPQRSSERFSCGVEMVEFADAYQQRRWGERVFAHLHPRMVVLDPQAAANRAWRVLDESGYVRLWAPREKRERVEAAYVQSWSGATPDVGQLMLIENHGQTVGTAASSLLFPKTWLLHQLGVAERERAGLTNFLSLTYELYSGLLYAFQHKASAEYFVVLAERDRKWTQTFYGDFVAKYPDRSAFVYDENRVFRRDPTSPISRIMQRTRMIEVTEADRQDLARVSLALKGTTTPLEFDAMAYDSSEIDLEQFSARCRLLGVERARSVFIAHDRGVRSAALIAESGGEGVNIFGLMNCCSIVNLGSEPVSDEVKRALLDTASQHFRSLDKPLFVFFDTPDADPESVEALGFEFISEGMRFIASKRVVPAWMNYLESVLLLRNAVEGSRSA